MYISNSVVFLFRCSLFPKIGHFVTSTLSNDTIPVRIYD